MANSGKHGPFEDDDGFDNRRQQRQYTNNSSPGSDGFDGILPPGNNNTAAGFFGGSPGLHPNSGVELEVLSSTSSHTRNDAVRDRLDQRTASDISSQAGQQADHRPLIAGEPLLRGIGELPVGLPAATPVDEGRHLQRRRRQQPAGDQEASEEGFASYKAPARHRSLVRPERQQAGEPSSRARAAAAARQRRKQQAGKPRRRRCCPNPWQAYCRTVTFWAPGRVLRCFGMPDTQVQMAWREKIGLVSLILLLMGAIAFLTFGFQQVLCGLSGQQTRIKWNEVGNGYVVVQGRAYDITKFKHAKASPWTGPANANIMGAPANAGGKDLSFLFQNPNSACHGVMNYDSSTKDANGNVVNAFPCVYYNASGSIDANQIPSNQGCHNSAAGRRALAQLDSTPVQYSWDDVRSQANLVVYNGAVLDLLRGQFLLPTAKPPAELAALIKGSMRGKDVSLHLSSGSMKDVGACALDLFRVGSIDASSLGCIAANIMLYVSLIVILGGVFAKFFMAIYFGWFMGPRLGQVRSDSAVDRKDRQAAIEAWADVNNHYDANGQNAEQLDRTYTVLADPTVRGGNAANRRSRFFPTTSRYSHFMPGDEPGARDKARIPARQSLFAVARQSASLTPIAATDESGPTAPMVTAVTSPWDFALAYTLLLVTCYSEGAHGIRTTLDSLSGTDYPASHKCLFIICDGLIKGAGEDMYTPDVCLSMMTDFVIPPDRVQAYSYVSIAQGAKRHNMAKLYAGYYSPGEKSPPHARENRVPMILVVKCGSPDEASEPKPGNRGKRDSQIILMSFLQRVMFDERMTELEYELFNAMWNVTGVTPDNFEIVLMVDADTKVYVDSLTRMVKAMVDDPTIMGQCGETKIANKTDSWVTMIQVFEYYIAHHQAKAFESVFGGVTCLPGCFCMYRIKAPKGQHGYWVPILANPDIVENYSENVVDTLHKKNLLLLGEDRYLSTLMLRTFPKRKMMFIPSAVCKTVVPDSFKILLSQRRRWINSTVHNLGELVLVNDLCGTFCLSMQFMIFMDLVGTLALPAAIVFTLYVIIVATFTRPVPWLPLSLLAVILGLPAVLIGLTSRKLVYIGWMLIYLCSLPIWNFVLPTYAYWHFDDFSWGQTRMVHGEDKDKGHGGANGEFDSSQIVMKRWCDFEAEKRRKTQVILGSVPSLAALAVSSIDLPPPLSARQSRLAVSRPGSVSNSINHEGSPRMLATRESMGEQVTSVGQVSILHQAATDMDDLDAQAAAGSIERLGYLTPNIIPMLASQGLSSRASYAPSLASPLGGYSTGQYSAPMSPDTSSYGGAYYNNSYEPLAAVPMVPPIPQQYVSASPRSERSKEESTNSSEKN